jgi:hypothetical protein
LVPEQGHEGWRQEVARLEGNTNLNGVDYLVGVIVVGVVRVINPPLDFGAVSRNSAHEERLRRGREHSCNTLIFTFEFK